MLALAKANEPTASHDLSTFKNRLIDNLNPNSISNERSVSMAVSDVRCAAME